MSKKKKNPHIRKKPHQRIAIFLYRQRQVEQVAGPSLGGAAHQTLHVRLHWNLVEILDLQSLSRENNCKEKLDGALTAINASDQSPTRDLSSICCCMKFRMARNTSSASCCVLTAKTTVSSSGVVRSIIQMWNGSVFLLTPEAVSVQTAEEVVMGRRLSEVALHWPQKFFQLQGDVTTCVRPRASSFPPFVQFTNPHYSFNTWEKQPGLFESFHRSLSCGDGSMFGSDTVTASSFRCYPETFQGTVGVLSVL